MIQPNEFMGRRLKVINENHPHAGVSGRIVKLEKTLIGYGFVVQGDHGLNFMIFDLTDIQWEQRKT